ncbi:hypothetical protein C1646_679786 [Rhizophagus diaphanus]|nr:hypothetical protein C1646_679786 [Rhizophagus diaphanus] [Rhizophagus sp. MUCL 43196]
MGLFFYLTSPINSIRCHKSHCETYYLVGREYEAFEITSQLDHFESDNSIIEIFNSNFSNKYF